MKKITLLLLLISNLAFGELPEHKELCGKSDGLKGFHNTKEELEKCKSGDLIIIQEETVPLFCDYRYMIHKVENSFDSPLTGKTYFSCVMRATFKEVFK